MSSSADASHNAIRILIADDHPVIREGLTAILELEEDLKVVGQAHDGEQACRLYRQLSPDILILDLRMPKKDGIEVVTELMSLRPRPRIIVLTHSAKAKDLRRASLIQTMPGEMVSDYLICKQEQKILVRSLRFERQSGKALASPFVSRLIDSEARTEKRPAVNPLASRARRTLRLSARPVSKLRI